MSTIDTFRRGASSGGPSAGFEFWLSAFAAGLAAAAERLDMMMAKHRSRRLLLELSDQQLKDIGISRADAYREADRPFWG